MEKLSRDEIDVFGEESVAYVGKVKTYSRSYTPRVTLGVIREKDNVVLAIGKELNGYVGDIIRTMYTGPRRGEGEYLLMSDRHGMICKFK